MKEINLSASEKFWEAEVKRLAQIDRIAIAVLTAVAFQNEKTGCAAERELAELLRSEYKVMFMALEQN